jgi:glycosyltransferase involved in cell wall biosynthesis
MRLLLDLQGAQGAARRSGLGRYSLELARALLRGAGAHEVSILVNTGLAEGAARIVDEFTPLLGRHRILRWQAPAGSAAGSDPQHPRRRLAEAMRAEVIRQAAPDVLHLGSVFEGWRDDAVTTWPAEWERPATAATLYDLIPLSLRDMYLDGLWRDAGLRPWYARCLDELSACDLLLPISEATREEALRHLDVPRTRLAVIGAGVGPEFRPPAAPDPALLARLGLRPGFLLYLGAGDPRKNEGALLAAFARLPPALRAAHPLAIGHVDPAGLRAAARAAGLAGHEFTALPFVPDADLPGLYASCALLVFPSLAEGFGLPLLEAMACGAPVIASSLSAMPEVVNRADALFDPRDPAALAALIERLLGDPAARADLAAWGRRRARDFSWDGVASRAWPALAALAPRQPARRKPTLALVSPLPPAASGIADYAAELLPELARTHAVTLVSGAPPGEGLQGRLPWLDEAAFSRHAHRFDRILFQLGNNPLHAPALRLLPRHPGYVVLHDALLDDLQNWMAAREAGPARRIESEGYPAQFGAPGSTGSLGVLESALGVAAHSHHAIAMLDGAHGPDAVASLRHLPHLRRPFAPPARAEARAALGLAAHDFVVASFGLATAKKLPGLLAEAVRLIGGARLVLVGAAEGVAAPEATGRVDADTYRRWLGAADVAVQLRAQSRGETSGAAMDALMAGLPLVSNRHGALAELPPEATLLLDDPPTAAALAEALAALRRDPARRAALGAAGRAWALAELDPARIADRLCWLMEAAYAAPGLLPILAEARTLPLEPVDAGPAGAALAATWPGPRQPRLWLDVALPEQATLALLREGAHPYRPEPCRWEGAAPATAHDWAWPRLGLAGAPPADGPALVTPRDAVLTEDAALAGWAAMQGARVLGWPGALPILRARL